jgi:hypothetical protein
MKDKNTKHWINSIARTLMAVAILITPSILVMPAPALAAEIETAKMEPAQSGQSSYLPLLMNRACAEKRSADNPFGVQIYGSLSGQPKHSSVFDNSLSPWVRNSIVWEDVEPTDREPIAYRWSVADRVALVTLANCANLIATIDITPPWATTGDGRSPFKPEFLPDFVEFVGALVERYDGDGVNDAPHGMVINYWEFYNEPDAGPSDTGGGWGEHGTRYAQMLEAVYPVVKAANPNAQVVFGGIAYDNFLTSPGVGVFVRDFLDNVLEAGGGDYFDIMNVHYYPFNSHRVTWTDSQSSGLIEKIESVEAILAENNVTKPLMITEIGWHSNSTEGTPSSLTNQSRMIVQLFTQSMALDAISIIWWPLFDTAYRFKSGLAEEDGDVKSSYSVYIEANKRLGNATFVETIEEATADDDLEVYEFREAGTNKRMYVAWLNPIAPLSAQQVPGFDDTKTESWQTSGNSANVYSKEGTLKQTVLDAADGDDDDMLTITVGTDPIYIVVD